MSADYPIKPAKYTSSPEEQLAKILESANALVASANEGFSGSRIVPFGTAKTVVMRSLETTEGESFAIRQHTALTELSHYITLAQHNKALTASVAHTDLLPVAHPASTRAHNMDYTTWRAHQARWVTSDPNIQDETTRALLASALTAPINSSEREYALARLQDMPTGYATLQALVAALPGANNYYWMQQWRDPKTGRFVEMGGGGSIVVANSDGTFDRQSGRVISVDVPNRTMDLELPNGKIIRVPAEKASTSKGYLRGDSDDDGISATKPKVDSSTTAVTPDEIQVVDSPSGFEKDADWSPSQDDKDYYGENADLGEKFTDGAYDVIRFDPNSQAAKDKFEAMQQKADEGQDKIAVGAGPDGAHDPSKPTFFVRRRTAEGEEFAALQSWVDTQSVIKKDVPRYEKNEPVNPDGGDVAPAEAQEQDQDQSDEQSDVADGSTEGIDVSDLEDWEIDQELKDAYDGWNKNKPSQERVRALEAEKRKRAPEREKRSKEAKEARDARNAKKVKDLTDDELIDSIFDVEIPGLASDLPMFPIDENRQIDGNGIVHRMQKEREQLERHKELMKEAERRGLDVWEIEKQRQLDAVDRMDARNAEKRRAKREGGKPAGQKPAGRKPAEQKSTGKKAPAAAYNVGDVVPNAADIPGAEIIPGIQRPSVGERNEYKRELKDYEKNGGLFPLDPSRDYVVLEDGTLIDQKTGVVVKDSKNNGDPKAYLNPGKTKPADKTEEKKPAAAKLPEKKEPFDVAPGQYEIDPNETYEPLGPIDGQESPDFTDDPAELAQKFTEEELTAALEQAVQGTKTDPSSGFGQLEFEGGDELIPAEAIYNALKEQGADADAILQEIYNKGGAKKKTATSEAFDRAKEKAKPAEDKKEEKEQAKLPALLDGLGDAEKEQYLEDGNYVQHLPENAIVDAPEGFADISPDPFDPEVNLAPEDAPEGFPQNPVDLANDFTSEELTAQLEKAIDRGSEMPGYGQIGMKTPEGDDFVANIPAEALRDALQLQGVDTDEIIARVYSKPEETKEEEKQDEKQQEDTEETTSKVETVEETQVSDLDGYAFIDPADGDVRAQIEKAILDKKRLKFFYNDKERDLTPIEITQTSRGNVVVLAYGEDGVEKQFILDKIEPSKDKPAATKPAETDETKPVVTYKRVGDLVLLRGGKGAPFRREDVAAFLDEKGFEWQGTIEREGQTFNVNAERAFMNDAEFKAFARELRDRFGIDIQPRSGQDPIDLDAPDAEPAESTTKTTEPAAVTPNQNQPRKLTPEQLEKIVSLVEERRAIQAQIDDADINGTATPEEREALKNRYNEISAQIDGIRGGWFKPGVGEKPATEEVSDSDKNVDAPEPEQITVRADQIKPGDITTRDNFTITKIELWGTKKSGGTVKNAYKITGYYPGSQEQSTKIWAADVAIPVYRGVEPPAPGDLPELRQPKLEDVGVTDRAMMEQIDYKGRKLWVPVEKAANAEFMRLYDEYLADLDARINSWTPPTGLPVSDKTKDPANEISENQPIHLVEDIGENLKPGDIAYTQDEDGNYQFFVIDEIGGKETVPNSKYGPQVKINIVGHYPGHQQQTKQWREDTPITVIRGESNLPEAGDKPALDRPEFRDPFWKEKEADRQKDINEASKAYSMPEIQQETKSEDGATATETTTTPAPERLPNPRQVKKPPFFGRIAEKIRGLKSKDEIKKAINEGRVVYFDLETIGKGFNEDAPDAPIQIAATVYENGEKVDEINLFVNPGEPLGSFYYEIDADGNRVLRADRMTDADGNPITDEWLAQQPSIEEQLKAFIDFAGPDATFVAHNAPFDINTVQKWADKLGIEFNPDSIIDTLELSRMVNPEAKGKGSHTLGTVAERYGVGKDASEYHNADADIDVLPGILNGLIDAASDDNGAFDIDARNAEYDKKMEIYTARKEEYNKQQEQLKAIGADSANNTTTVDNTANSTDEAGSAAPIPSVVGGNVNKSWAEDDENTQPVKEGSAKVSDVQVGDFVPSKDGSYYEVVEVRKDSDTNSGSFVLRDLETGDLREVPVDNLDRSVEASGRPLRRRNTMANLTAGEAAQTPKRDGDSKDPALIPDVAPPAGAAQTPAEEASAVSNSIDEFVETEGATGVKDSVKTDVVDEEGTSEYHFDANGNALKVGDKVRSKKTGRVGVVRAFIAKFGKNEYKNYLKVKYDDASKRENVAAGTLERMDSGSADQVFGPNPAVITAEKPAEAPDTSKPAENVVETDQVEYEYTKSAARWLQPGDQFNGGKVISVWSGDSKTPRGKVSVVYERDFDGKKVKAIWGASTQISIARPVPKKVETPEATTQELRPEIFQADDAQLKRIEARYNPDAFAALAKKYDDFDPEEFYRRIPEGNRNVILGREILKELSPKFSADIKKRNDTAMKDSTTREERRFDEEVSSAITAADHEALMAKREGSSEEERLNMAAEDMTGGAEEEISEQEFSDEVVETADELDAASAKVTDAIIAALEAGVAPWRMPWSGGGMIPTNATTGREYSGSNIMALWATAATKGYTDNRWLTYNQAKALGGNVKKGEKGTPILFWKPITKEVEKPDGTVETKRWYGRPRVHYVFNVDQVEGIEFPAAVKREPVPVTEAERIMLERYKDKPPIINGMQNEAYWSPSKDEIRLPLREQFESDLSYFETIAHELTHSTGHKSRLDRSNLIDNYRHTEVRAEEELIAEIGASILGARLNVDMDMDNVASYVQSWLNAVKNDRGLIIKAAKEAQKAADHILGKGFTLANDVPETDATPDGAKAPETPEVSTPETPNVGTEGKTGEQIAAEKEAEAPTPVTTETPNVGTEGKTGDQIEAEGKVGEDLGDAPDGALFPSSLIIPEPDQKESSAPSASEEFPDAPVFSNWELQGFRDYEKSREQAYEAANAWLDKYEEFRQRQNPNYKLSAVARSNSVKKMVDRARATHRESYIYRQGNVVVELDQDMGEPEAVAALMQKIKDITDAFPPKDGKEVYIRINKNKALRSTRGGDALASYLSGEGRTVLNLYGAMNPSSPKDGGTLNGSTSGFDSVVDRFVYTFAHEWGHAFDYSTADTRFADLDPSKTPRNLQMVSKNFNEALKEYDKQNGTDLFNGVSEYANSYTNKTVKYLENFAEAFAQLIAEDMYSAPKEKYTEILRDVLRSEGMYNGN